MSFVIKAVKSVVKAAVGVVKTVFKGIGMVLGAVKPKVNAKNRATDGRLSKSLEPEDFRKIVFGETALATDLRFWEVHGPKNDNYSEVLAAAGHEIESFGALYIEDELVTWSGEAATGKFAGVLFRKTNTGAPGAAALAVGAGTYWDANSKFTGTAHYALKWIVDEKKLPGGVPSRYTQVGKGARVYDPRLDTTRGGSGTMRANDQTTWGYATLDGNGKPIGRNNALQMLWYLIGWRINGNLVCGRGVDLNDINWPEWIAAANDAEARGHYTDMILSTGDDHGQNESIISADGLLGELLDPGGLWTYKVVKDDTADIAVDLGENDVLDAGDVVWLPEAKLGDKFNEVAGTYVDPISLYQTKAYVTVKDASYVTADGYRKRASHSFQCVQDTSLAQKLTRVKLNRNRFTGEFTATFGYRALKAQVWSIIRLTIDRYGFDNKLFRVMSQSITQDGIEMLLREENSTIYSAGSVTVPSPPASNPAKYDTTQTVALTTYGATPFTQAGANATVEVGVRLAWDALPGNVRRVEVEYKPTAQSFWANGGVVGGDKTTIDVVGLLGQTSYQFRARTWTIHEVPSAWQTLSSTTGAAVLDFAGVGGLTRPSDYAGTSLTFYRVGTHGADLLIQGNKITRPSYSSGGAAWNAAAVSNQYFPKTVLLSTRTIGTWTGAAGQIGISGAGFGAGELDIDYSFYCNNSLVYAAVNGALVSSSAALPAGAQLVLTYDGVNVTWYVGGNVLHTVAASANLTMLVHMSIAYDGGHGWTDIMAAPHTDQVLATAATARITSISSDSVLDRAEKPQIIVDYAAITNEQAGIDAQATAYGITTEKMAYDAAVTALTTYLGALTPGWNDTTQDTAIVAATFRSKFTDVYGTRQTLLNLIDAIAGTRANWSGVANTGGKPSDYAGVTLHFVESDGGHFTFQGNKASKVSANDGNFRIAWSEEYTVGTAFVMGTLDAVDTILGFSETRPGGATPTNIKYGIYRHPNGNLYTIEDGVTLTNFGTAPALGTQFLITYDGVNVRYYTPASSVPIRTVASAADRRFWAGIAIAATGASISNIIFGPHTDSALATAATARITSISSDSVLDRSEKSQIVLDYAAITNEQSGIDGRATAYGITTQKTNYDDAVTALTTYLGGLSPAWNDLASDTPIVGATFRSKFTDVYLYRQALLNQIDAIAGTVANWSGVVDTGGRPSNYAGTTLSFSLVGTHAADLVVQGNKVIRPSYSSGGAAWNAGAYSDQFFPSTMMMLARCASAFTGGQGIIGMSSNGFTAAFGDVDYGFNCTNGLVSAMLAGVTVSGTTAIGPGSSLGMTYDGNFVRYYVNGALFWTETALPDLIMRVHLSIPYDGSHGWQDIMAAPHSENVWNSLGGAGRPADYATADMVFTSIGSQSVTLRGNTFKRNAGNGDYNACVRGEPTVGAIYAEVDINTTSGDYTMISLDDSAGNSDLGSMKIMCHYQYTSGAYAIYIDGVNVASGSAGVVVGKLALVYDGVRFRFFVGPTQRGGDHVAAAGLTLWPKWHAYDNVRTYTGMRAFQGNSNLWAGFGGTGKPEDYADVTLTAQVVVTNPTLQTVTATYLGAINSGQLPRVVTPTVTKGGVDKRTDNLTTYSVSDLTGGCVGNVSVNNTTGNADKGRQTITTGLTASGTYKLNVTYNGVAQPAITVVVTKQNADPPEGGGGGGAGNKGGSFDPTGMGASSTGYVELDRIENLVKASGETIRAYFDATLEVYAGANATRTMTAQWQYSVAGANSWTAFSSPASSYTSTSMTYVAADYSSDMGSITCNQTAAPADGTYDIRLVALESSSANSSSVVVVTGTASVAIAV